MCQAHITAESVTNQGLLSHRWHSPSAWTGCGTSLGSAEKGDLELGMLNVVHAREPHQPSHQIPWGWGEPWVG